jgi:hypothetical protein
VSALERFEPDVESGKSANPACGCPTPRDLLAKMMHPVLRKAAAAAASAAAEEDQEEAGRFRRRAVR